MRPAAESKMPTSCTSPSRIKSLIIMVTADLDRLIDLDMSMREIGRSRMQRSTIARLALRIVDILEAFRSSITPVPFP